MVTDVWLQKKPILRNMPNDVQAPTHCYSDVFHSLEILSDRLRQKVCEGSPPAFKMENEKS